MPLFLHLYVNDLNLIISNLFKLMFANDTLVLRTDTKLTLITDQLNNDLGFLAYWMNYNKLSINGST